MTEFVHHHFGRLRWDKYLIECPDTKVGGHRITRSIATSGPPLSAAENGFTRESVAWIDAIVPLDQMVPLSISTARARIAAELHTSLGTSIWLESRWGEPQTADAIRRFAPAGASDFCEVDADALSRALALRNVCYSFADDGKTPIAMLDFRLPELEGVDDYVISVELWPDGSISNISAES